VIIETLQNSKAHVCYNIKNGKPQMGFVTDGKEG
jgi:hypothetical protein